MFDFDLDIAIHVMEEWKDISTGLENNQISIYSLRSCVEINRGQSKKQC